MIAVIYITQPNRKGEGKKFWGFILLLRKQLEKKYCYLYHPNQSQGQRGQSPSGVYGWFFTKLMMLKTAKRSEIY